MEFIDDVWSAEIALACAAWPSFGIPCRRDARSIDFNRTWINLLPRGQLLTRMAKVDDG